MHYPTSFRLPSLRTPETARDFYHPELDVLRFFAFLAVFFHHAIPAESAFYARGGLSPTITQWLLAAKEAGAYGVDLFFVLSSYLITELLLREHARRGTFSVAAFYARRALRIWPLYFVFIAATIFIVPALLPQEQFGPIYIVSFLLFFGNWACAIYGLPFSVASPLWSISVEEQFYIGWPLALRLIGIHRIKVIAFSLLGIAIGTRVFLAVGGFQHPAVWCNTLARLDPIALGALLALFLGGRAPQISNALRFALLGLSFAIFLLVAKFLSQDGPTSVLTYAATAVASVCLLVAFLRNEASFLRVAPFSWLVYLGRISYGLYVFHLLALVLVARVLIPQLPNGISFEGRRIVSFLLTLLLAAVSYHLLEKPFLRLKKRFTYTPSGPDEEAVRDRPEVKRQAWST